MENYLEAIYELSGGSCGARVSDISEKLGVTKASVNNAMVTLANKGFVINEKYKEVFLTPAGLEQAKLTSEKHNIIREFLPRCLKLMKKLDGCMFYRTCYQQRFHPCHERLFTD